MLTGVGTTCRAVVDDLDPRGRDVDLLGAVRVDSVSRRRVVVDHRGGGTDVALCLQDRRGREQQASYGVDHVDGPGGCDDRMATVDDRVVRSAVRHRVGDRVEARANCSLLTADDTSTRTR